MQSSKYLPCQSIFSSSAYLHIILVDYILGKKVSIENRAATKKDTSTKKWTIQLVLLSSYVQKKTLGMPFTIIASRWAVLKLNIASTT